MPINKAAGRLLQRARELARSGAYASYHRIEEDLRHWDGYSSARRWFKDQEFRAQLDELCRAARRKDGF